MKNKLQNLKNKMSILFRPHGKISFLNTLKFDASILDVGCGNDSVINIKRILPRSNYTGIDVNDYNLSSEGKKLIDKYIVVNESDFAATIARYPNRFDAVISSHNLEHCDERRETFEAMLASVKSGGQIFLSFPSKNTTKFPSRSGTLNYFDDKTHKFFPPDFEQLSSILISKNFEIIFATEEYKPLVLYLLGFLFEPISKIRKKVMSCFVKLNTHQFCVLLIRSYA